MPRPHQVENALRLVVLEQGQPDPAPSVPGLRFDDGLKQQHHSLAEAARMSRTFFSLTGMPQRVPVELPDASETPHRLEVEVEGPSAEAEGLLRVYLYSLEATPFRLRWRGTTFHVGSHPSGGFRYDSFLVAPVTPKGPEADLALGNPER